MFLFVKIFCQPYRKQVIENIQAFGGTHAKDYSSWDFRDIVNLKLSLHLVHICVCPIISLKKKLWNFLKCMNFWGKINNFKLKKKTITNL